MIGVPWLRVNQSDIFKLQAYKPPTEIDWESQVYELEFRLSFSPMNELLDSPSHLVLLHQGIKTVTSVGNGLASRWSWGIHGIFTFELFWVIFSHCHRAKESTCPWKTDLAKTLWDKYSMVWTLWDKHSMVRILWDKHSIVWKRRGSILLLEPTFL